MAITLKMSKNVFEKKIAKKNEKEKLKGIHCYV